MLLELNDGASMQSLPRAIEGSGQPLAQISRWESSSKKRQHVRQQIGLMSKSPTHETCEKVNSHNQRKLRDWSNRKGSRPLRIEIGSCHLLTKETKEIVSLCLFSAWFTHLLRHLADFHGGDDAVPQRKVIDDLRREESSGVWNYQDWKYASAYATDKSRFEVYKFVVVELVYIRAIQGNSVVPLVDPAHFNMQGIHENLKYYAFVLRPHSFIGL